jgi:biotin transport system substrate-specific component
MKTKEMTFVALFAAIMIVLGFLPPIVLPFTPVPITAQTLGVMLAGVVLGARLGGMSMIVFLLVIAAGVPGLAGGRGGAGVFVGPSAGYILSWPLSAFLIGLLIEKARQPLQVWKVFLYNFVAGIVFVYLCGIPVVAFVMDISLGTAAVSGLAYLPGDLIKAVIAATLGVKIRQRLFKNQTALTQNRTISQ